MSINTKDSTHRHHQMVNTETDWLYSLQTRWKSSIQSVKTRPGADRSSDPEPLIAKFRLKLKKAWKATRLFRYDLNQIIYNYTVEVTSRFKRLNMIEYLKNYGGKFMTLYRKQWYTPFLRKSNANRWNGCLRRPYK